MAAVGSRLMSGAPAPIGAGASGRPLNSTRVREAPRPRRLTVAAPSEPWARASNWLVSPSTPLETGSCFISSTVEGEPCFCRSSELITSTGRAASSGVPAMNEPVTTTSSTVVDWAAAWPLHAAASTTARAVPPARWLILDIESLFDAPVFDANVGIREGCAEATGEASGGEGSGEQSSSPVTAAPQAAKARNSNWLDGQWKRREASLGE